MRQRSGFVVSVLGLTAAIGLQTGSVRAQTPAARPASAQTAAPDPAKPQRMDLAEGTVARYKVREQLAGISFPSDAVGTTSAVTGTIVLNPDGSIDAKQSKIVADLKTLRSDQSMRDGYVQSRVLETETYPTLEFVPKRAVDLKMPLPSTPPAQAGFQLVGDMTLHGVTKEVTWTVISTFANDSVAGRATTTIAFADFGMTKPSLARLLSVDDNIQLEIEFRAKRRGL